MAFAKSLLPEKSFSCSSNQSASASSFGLAFAMRAALRWPGGLPAIRPYPALPVERQMRPVFCEQNLRQKLGAGAAAGDRMERRRRLRDAEALSAVELFAHMLDHLCVSAWNKGSDAFLVQSGL